MTSADSIRQLNGEIDRLRSQLNDRLEELRAIQGPTPENQVQKNDRSKPEKRADEILGSMTDAYVVFDNQWRVVEVNRVAEETVFNKPAKELLGKIIFVNYPQLEHSDYFENYRIARKERHPVHFEAKSDISGQWFEGHAYPRSNRLEVYIRNINKRKLAEDALRRYTAELEAANRELESFSYSVSHDLRAPLRSLDGFSLAILEDYGDKLDERGKEYVQRIRSSAQLMGQLIDDLLNLSRVIRAEINITEINLSEMAEETARELTATQPERQVEFKICPGMECHADRNLIKVVLGNLLGNAFKFTGQCARAEIEVGLEKTANRCTYFVRDNGAGFDMLYADKLFKPFQRLHSIKEFQGTGIGLATVQRIINRHGGNIWAKGEVGKGATFYFDLNDQEGK